MTICGYCGHLGYHVQVIPTGAEPSRRCGDCPECLWERNQQADRRR